MGLGLVLDDDDSNSARSFGEIGAMSCELGSHGLRVAKEKFEIGTSGMKDLETG